ncbi:MAG: AtpZ/AtpI family protein [Chloroflexi bacterium]|nr:AtpZ/AtpI family protein [Chloroflexota bacterium]
MKHKLPDRKEHHARQAWRALAYATTLGWVLALPIFGGTLLGYWLDHRLHTGMTMTLGLMALGVFIGFYNLYNIMQREADADRTPSGLDEEEVEETKRRL